jgi:RHS repeat-associated protein
MMVTNLRLPGQYDERLLSSLGLQGPYYNWNRWYLPSIGRYLELDPWALRGGLNSGLTPDWYSYASGNPLTYTDPRGLQAVPVPVPCVPGESSIACKCKQDPTVCVLLPPPRPTPKPDPRPKPDPGCKDPKETCAEHYKKCEEAANGYSLTIMDCIDCEVRCNSRNGQWPWDAVDANDRRMCDYNNPGWNH